MQEFPAFFVLIKTNFGKTIATFVDSKYESTINMNHEINGEKYTNRKETTNEILFYYLDNKLIKSKYNHKIKPAMESNDEYFL
jgi:hypothetical protein